MSLIKLIYLPVRYISYTSINHSKHTYQSRILSKFVYGKRKKKIWYESKVTQTIQTVSNITKGSGNQRRQSVLNKLFMRYASDILATGSLVDKIAGNGLQISGIKITSDFKILNIFWYSNEDALDKIKEILESYKNTLRHELTQLNLIGHVPKIEFVQDKKYIYINQIQKMMGNITIHDDISEDTPTSIENISIPSMSSNVLNLNHDLIMNRIKSRMKKTKALHRINPNEEFELNVKNSKDADIKTDQIVTLNINEYLKKKALTKRKYKRNKNIYLETDAEDDYSEEELTDGFNDTFK